MRAGLKHSSGSNLLSCKVPPASVFWPRDQRRSPKLFVSSPRRRIVSLPFSFKLPYIVPNSVPHTYTLSGQFNKRCANYHKKKLGIWLIAKPIRGQIRKGRVLK